MREVRIQAEVPAEPRRVWDVFVDCRRWPDWSGVKEVVLRNEGEPAPYGVGAACVLRAHGIAIEEEITGFSPCEQLRYRIVAGLPLRSHEAWVQFEPAGGGTRLDWRVRFVPRIPGTGGWIATVFERELGRIVERLRGYPFERVEPHAS